MSTVDYEIYDGEIILTIPVQISREVDVEVKTQDLIRMIGDLPVHEKWNTSAVLLKHFGLDQGDVMKLTPAHQEVVKAFLNRALAFFSTENP